MAWHRHRIPTSRLQTPARIIYHVNNQQLGAKSKSSLTTATSSNLAMALACAKPTLAIDLRNQVAKLRVLLKPSAMNS